MEAVACIMRPAYKMVGFKKHFFFDVDISVSVVNCLNLQCVPHGMFGMKVNGTRVGCSKSPM